MHSNEFRKVIQKKHTALSIEFDVIKPMPGYSIVCEMKS